MYSSVFQIEDMLNILCVYVCVCADLKTLNEKREDIQDTEADLGRHVALQQSLMVDFCFRRPRPFNTLKKNITIQSLLTSLKKNLMITKFSLSINTNFIVVN